MLEAVNHSDVLMESLDCPMTKPVAEQTLSPMQELNAEGQICEAQGAAAAEGGGSPWASK